MELTLDKQFARKLVFNGFSTLLLFPVKPPTLTERNHMRLSIGVRLWGDQQTVVPRAFALPLHTSDSGGGKENCRDTEMIRTAAWT